MSLPVLHEALHEDEDFVQACKDRTQDLVYFALNVGDADAGVLLLPEAGGQRQVVVVDAGVSNKVPDLLEELVARELFVDDPQQLNGAAAIPLVVATHPHADHIDGLGQLLDAYHSVVGELWEPGYVHPSGAFADMIDALEAHPGIGHLQPTSGTARVIGKVRVTVLAPAVALRNRYHSYGIDVNNSSLTLKFEFPASRVKVLANGDREYMPKLRDRTPALVLGGDAQTQSWSQVLTDFPQLSPGSSVVKRALRQARGYEPLRAQVFKVPHHGSKNGLNLELVNEIKPKVSIVSCCEPSDHGFPHQVAINQLREANKPLAKKGIPHSPDDDHTLGIHCTASKEGVDTALGSVAVVVTPGARCTVWRFGDGVGDALDLTTARRYVG